MNKRQTYNFTNQSNDVELESADKQTESTKVMFHSWACGRGRGNKKTRENLI